MGVKGSKFRESSHVHPGRAEEAIDDGVKVVSLNVYQRQYHSYESELKAFCAGFFLNKDLDCAKISNCNREIYWMLHVICEGARNGAKYRIAEAIGSPCTYVIVKPEKDESLERFGIKRDEITVEVSYLALVPNKSSFQKLIGDFMEDADLETLVLQHVGTGDFPAVCEILKPFARFAFDTETVSLKDGSQHFDYVIRKKQESKEKATDKKLDSSQYLPQ